MTKCIWIALAAAQESTVSTADRARELVQRFLDTADTNRELLVSLIERVELTEDKEVITRFRFHELEDAQKVQEFA